jgi:actin-related protein 5
VVFDSIVHRWKDEEEGLGSMVMKVGRGIPTGSNVRATSRSAFENGLPVHTPTIENIFDFIFAKMTCKNSQFSLVMTETPLIPAYCRQELLELLFEAYNCIDRVAFVLDGPSSSCLSEDSALIIHIGASHTHVYPIVGGRIDWSQVKRLNWGGVLAADFLLKIMGLKYPGILNSTNPNRLTVSHAQAIWQRTGLVAPDISTFEREMDSLSDPSCDALEAMDCCIRLTGDAASESTRKEAVEEAKRLAEQNQLALQEKRRLLADKLRQKAEEQRAAKIRSKEHIYKALQGLLNRVQGIHKKQQQQQQQQKNSKKPKTEDEDISMDFSEEEEQDGEEEEDFADDAEVPFTLASLGGDVKLFEELKRLGFKGLGALQDGLRRSEEEFFRVSGSGEGVPTASYDFSLLSVPDGELSEAEIREKRRLRLIKSSADARERQKAEKAAEDAKRQALSESLERKRLTDLSAWRLQLYTKRTDLLRKLERKQKQRADRKGALQGSRFRSVVALGESTDNAATSGQAAGNAMPSDSGPDDGFGLNDDDWLVYRQVSRDEDEDQDLHDQDQLAQIEALLEEKDPLEFMRVLQGEQVAALTLLDRLTGDGNFEQPEIHVNAERMRCTEGLFQPLSVQGIDQAGLPEILANLLAAYPTATQESLIKNVHVSGGPSALPGLKNRIVNELSAVIPDHLVPLLNVSLCSDLEAAWKGIQKRLLRKEHKFNWISRNQYLEAKKAHDAAQDMCQPPQDSKKKSKNSKSKTAVAPPVILEIPITEPFSSDCSNPY